MTAGYDAFARRVVESGILNDPWLDGAPRFREEPVLVSRPAARELCRAGAEIAEAYDEACRLVSDDPALLDDFFGLTHWQKALWRASEPLWHGIARADVFVTDEGLAVAELNCDTPTGEPEAVVLGALAAETRPDASDPNRHLASRFCEMVELCRAELAGDGAPRTVGLVYPTEFTEDLSLVRLYKRWFEERGKVAVLGSPYNLGATEQGGLTLFDEPIGVMIRHYKTDWWTERAGAWLDEEIPDHQPLAGPLRSVLAAIVARKVAVVNPFGSVLPQNKRLMAFMWERIHRFSPAAQGTIQRLLPYTTRLETAHREMLLAQRDEWVLKSDYGAEGEEVIIGRLVSDDAWRAALDLARPGRWVAQRRFDAQLNENGEATNFGVYLVAGEPSGLYARVQAGPTDGAALSVPVLITA